MREASSEGTSATVPPPATQAEEAPGTKWSWVERAVWTERMLEALDKGVKGGKWFSLVDKVWNLKTLGRAWQKVRSNAGSAGVDHQSVKDFEAQAEQNLAQLHKELKEGTYRPRPIRRVWIDKPGSKDKRPLGIPVVRDRVVQTAIVLVIEPIFEKLFTPQSYAFRPNRGCKDALRQVETLLEAQYQVVVDADLQSYFETIDHELLMALLREHIADERLLQLIEQFLKQDVVSEMQRWSPESGAPQGAVLSPLLSNLFLHPLDKAISEAGFELVRYADDLVILCRTEQEAHGALHKLEELTERAHLKLHPQKTRIVDISKPGASFDFLGYHFERTQRLLTRWPRSKSSQKLKDAIRTKTRRTNGESLSVIIEKVNRTLRGWFEYFKHSHGTTFPRLDSWIRRRLRSILRIRSKRKGISRGYDHNRWPNRFFQDAGLFCLADAHRASFQSS